MTVNFIFAFLVLVVLLISDIVMANLKSEDFVCQEHMSHYKQFLSTIVVNKYIIF